VSSGIDLNVFRPRLEKECIRRKYGIPTRPILLYVGRLDPEKKLDQALRAAALALKTADFQFVLVGRGISRASLERQARELGILEFVTFTGFMPDEDLPDIYTSSRCFIIPSTAELLSLATLQAMASGLPVIAVNAGALGELVQDGSNGFLCNSGDIEGMARCIRELVGNDELCAGMSAKSLEYVPFHDIQATVGVFEGLYKQQGPDSLRAGHPDPVAKVS
jgi:glycosyltransferase involved in cell wall biosynthesis